MISSAKELKDLVIVSHVSYDGANFLIGCLAMSNKCHFMNCDKAAKAQYFLNRLESTFSNYGDRWDWNDPGMHWPVFNNGPDTNSKDIEGKYLFLKVHYYDEPSYEINQLTPSLDFFTQQKHVILVENGATLHYLRNIADVSGNGIFNSNDIDHTSFKKSDFLNNLDFDQYFALSGEEKQKIRDKYYIKVHDIEKLSEKYPEKIFHTWDADWFLYENKTLENIEKLYDALGLDDYKENSAMLSFFYKKWIEKLREIKTFLINTANNKLE